MAGKAPVCTIRLDGHMARVSEHAAERWLERVRNDADRPLAAVHRDILRIARACGRWVEEPPAWWAENEDEPSPPDGFFTFGPDIVMPVCARVAVTTVTRGAMSRERAEARRSRRKARRAGRAAARSAKGKYGWSWGRPPEKGNAIIPEPEQQEAM